ncbi:hypothetical protein CNEO4_390029 [Clostridium neonatale]|uniref:Uncharacterized protein n=1 Tax=Clostridium neonatale TaxID=137838 RepID=A0AA86JIB4_9CLOT|nr:hypothetical protein CNEO_44215 [Clostridium neonatale]CAI3583636.1 hypothetical protein CNEO3_160066 [Clostridium neonatale]CAI3589919.1 hypothetical protein CNEO3_150065 [Clostridium neonatale]CAI3611306.1 hypothetical protein CNEO4_740002 [Clostridium neonatale]CAI3614639.1 hypothetical protein CNEO3_250066 [Clostridium neonatale]
MIKWQIGIYNLNTSHVNLNRVDTGKENILSRYLNTSHVNLNQQWKREKIDSKEI